jgi:hypothetical protein
MEAALEVESREIRPTPRVLASNPCWRGGITSLTPCVNHTWLSGGPYDGNLEWGIGFRTSVDFNRSQQCGLAESMLPSIRKRPFIAPQGQCGLKHDPAVPKVRS